MKTNIRIICIIMKPAALLQEMREKLRTKRRRKEWEPERKLPLHYAADFASVFLQE